MRCHQINGIYIAYPDAEVILDVVCRKMQMGLVFRRVQAN